MAPTTMTLFVSARDVYTTSNQPTLEARTHSLHSGREEAVPNIEKAKGADNAHPFSKFFPVRGYRR